VTLYKVTVSGKVYFVTLENISRLCRQFLGLEYRLELATQEDFRDSYLIRVKHET